MQKSIFLKYPIDIKLLIHGSKMVRVGGHKQDKARWFTIERVYCIKHVRLVGVLLSNCVWQAGVCLIYIVC